MPQWICLECDERIDDLNELDERPSDLPRVETKKVCPINECTGSRFAITDVSS